MPSRAQARASVTGGSAAQVQQAQTTKLDRLGDQADYLSGVYAGPAVASGSLITNDPVPMYTPYLAPGVRGKAGETLYLALLQSYGKFMQGPRYGFRFHWNPATIQTSISMDPVAAANAATTGASDSALGVYATISFVFLINRQEEAATKKMLPRGLTLASGALANTFAEAGTIWDIEHLMRSINGAPYSEFDSALQTTYLGAGGAVVLDMGRSMQWRGFVIQLDITHQMFTPQMVPTVTMVSMTMSGITNSNAPDTNDNGGDKNNPNDPAYWAPGGEGNAQLRRSYEAAIKKNK